MLWLKNIFNNFIRLLFKNTLYRIRHLRFCLSRRSDHPSFSLTCHFGSGISHSFYAAVV